MQEVKLELRRLRRIRYFIMHTNLLTEANLVIREIPPRRETSGNETEQPQIPTPPVLTPYEQASVDMLAGITKLLENQVSKPKISHEEEGG